MVSVGLRMGLVVDFDKFSDSYKDVLDSTVSISGDGSEYFTEYKARYLATQTGAGFAGKILDFGCGVGLLSTFIREYLPNSRLDGFDPSSDCVNAISKQIVEEGVFTSDISDLSNDYDLIVISNVMHHIPLDDREETINFLMNHLCAQGKLVIFEHNPLNPITRRVVGKCPFDDDVILLPIEKTISYLSSAGMHTVKHDYIVFFPRFLFFLRWLEPFLRWCPAGAQYAVVATND